MTSFLKQLVPRMIPNAEAIFTFELKVLIKPIKWFVCNRHHQKEQFSFCMIKIIAELFELVFM